MRRARFRTIAKNCCTHRAQDFASRAVKQTERGIARSARMRFLPPRFPSAIALRSGKLATQVPAVFAAIVSMTAV
jgi:hypothetical protein